MPSSHNALERSYFSTYELSPEYRYQTWQESIGVVFEYNLDSSIQLEAFNAQIESYLIGSFMSAECISKKGEWRRTAKTIAQDGLDMYMVQVFAQGEWAIERQNHLDVAKPGSIIILDLAQAKKTFTTDFKNFTLCIPRIMLEPLLNYPDDQHGRILDANHPMTKLLANHLITLHKQAPIMSWEEANNLGTPTLELIASVLNTTFEQKNTIGSTQFNNARITQIKQFIAANLHLAELNSELICKELCLSRSTLYRLSSPFGGVQNYIKKLRLKQSFNDLLNPKYAHQSILDICLKWGFNDSSSFSRSFKTEFGITPREIRNEGRNPLAPSSELTNLTGIGDRQYENWLTHLI